MNLPTSEEYAAMCVPAIFNTQQYSEPKYICPVCGGGMCRDETVICPSNPPKRKYVCDKCGNVEYQYQ